LSSAVGTDWLARSGLSRGVQKTQLWHEAAFGMMEATARVECGTHLSGRFWNACHGGQVAVERGRYV
jgi:uncharacterized protein